MRLRVLTVAVAGLALVPASAAGTWGGDTGRVAYDAFPEHGDMAVWSIRPDGTHNRLLVRDANDPSWSPRGRKLVFYRDNAIYRARADGSHVRRIVKGPGDAVFEPTWSPDGRRVAFTAEFEFQDGEEVSTEDWIYTVRADGRQLRRIRRGHAPVWSPRAKRIAFVAAGIWSIGTNGEKLRRLAPDEGYVGELDFSPNGRRLVYQAGFGPTAIRVLNVLTRKERKISRKRLGRPTEARWTPSGRRIAYLHAALPKQQPGVHPPTVLRTIKPNGRGRRDAFQFRPRRWPFSFAWQALRR